TLYVSHLSSSTDIDLYHFKTAASGKQRASIILSNLPADYDLTLFGPKPAQIGANPPVKQSLEPVADTASSLYTPDVHSAPDVTNDIPLTPPTAAVGVVQISANRNTTSDEIDTGTLVPNADYYVQVSGYNGASSPLPYALRASLIGVNPPPCAPPVR